MLNTALVPHDVHLCCTDCGHWEAQTLCGWKACSLTSDLSLSSQIAAELIQSSAVAAALHSLVSLVQLLPQVYWDQGCFWFTSSAARWTSTLKNHSAASYCCYSSGFILFFYSFAFLKIYYVFLFILHLNAFLIIGLLLQHNIHILYHGKYPSPLKFHIKIVDGKYDNYIVINTVRTNIIIIHWK